MTRQQIELEMTRLVNVDTNLITVFLPPCALLPEIPNLNADMTSTADLIENFRSVSKALQKGLR